MQKNKDKKEEKINKKKADKMAVATKIIAGILVLLMLLSIAGSFIYYLLKIIYLFYHNPSSEILSLK